MSDIEIIRAGELVKKEHTYVAEIDGDKCENTANFLNEISEAFQFPDYFGNNYDSLAECLNDLSWLDKSNYALVIRNYNSLLKEEDDKTLSNTINLLKGVAKEWESVPNFEGEDEFREKSNFSLFTEEQ